MKKKKDSKINDIYEETLSTLNREVVYYKLANFKKETRKIIKMKHFLSYFNSYNNSFLNTPLDLLWYLNYLTPKFLEDIAKYEYEEIIPLIIKILIGDFKGAEKKNKFMKLNQSYKKLCSFYLLKLNDKSNENIFFCLCLEGKNSPNTAIYFLSIATNWDFEEIGKNFYEKIDNDSNFPIVDYDRNGLLTEEILFSHKEIDKESGRTVCYPLKNISICSNEIFLTEFIHSNIIKIYNNANDFKNNELTESIIEQIEDDKYDKKIVDLIEGNNDCWNYKLSGQEKKYIKNSNPIILSGRAGTGKTTVILFKLFSIYFNYQLKKKKE